MTTKTYQITDTTGNQIIGAGSDLAAARVRAQSYADRWHSLAYLSERGAAGDDYETFDFITSLLPQQETAAKKRASIAAARNGRKTYLRTEQYGGCDVTYAKSCNGKVVRTVLGPDGQEFSVRTVG